MDVYRSISRRRFLQSSAVVGAGLAVAGPLVVAGCSSTPAASSGGGAIKVLTLGEGIFGAPFVKLAQAFTDETGIPVTMVTMGYDEAIAKSTAMFAAKSDELDVVQLDYIFVKGLAKAGHLQPLDPFIDKADLDDFFADVPASFKEMYEWEGKPVGMATIGNCQKFVYNETALSDVGLSVPATWAELLTAAQKIAASGSGVYGFTAGLEKLVKATGVWLPIFWANGGILLDGDMRPSINSQAGYDALDFLLELVATMPPGGSAYTEGDEIKSIATGLAALDPVAWVPDGYTTADADVKDSIKFGVSPKGSAMNAPVMGGLGLAVSSYSKLKGEAAEYVRWFNSKKVQSELIVANGGQPCRNSAWDANADAQPWFKAQADNLKVAVVRPQIPEWGQVDTAIGTQMSRALSGEVTTKQALDQAQTDVDQIMKDGGYYS